MCRAYETAWPEEIFFEARPRPGVDYRNSEDAQERGNFFMFRAEQIVRWPELSYPDISARRAMFDLYLDNLRAVFSNDRILIDIKYTSWHHLDGFWRSPTDPPGLIELIREKNIPVVHLVRQNMFALYCSQRMAVMSGIWTRERWEPADTRTLKVDLEDCREWMMNMTNTRRLFRKWLQGSRVYDLTYETLTENGGFAKGVSEVFTDIFGRPPVRELSTDYVKILPRLYHLVENAQAVMDYFAGSEFEVFVNASLWRSGDEMPLDAKTPV